MSRRNHEHKFQLKYSLCDFISNLVGILIDGFIEL
jgi:hypothetical protein